MNTIGYVIFVDDDQIHNVISFVMEVNFINNKEVEIVSRTTFNYLEIWDYIDKKLTVFRDGKCILRDKIRTAFSNPDKIGTSFIETKEIRELSI